MAKTPTQQGKVAAGAAQANTDVEAGKAKAGAAKVGTAKTGTGKTGTAKTGTGKTGTAKVGLSKAGMGQKPRAFQGARNWFNVRVGRPTAMYYWIHGGNHFTRRRSLQLVREGIGLCRGRVGADVCAVVRSGVAVEEDCSGSLSFCRCPARVDLHALGR